MCFSKSKNLSFAVLLIILVSCSIKLPVSSSGQAPSPSDKVGYAKVVAPFGLVFGGDASIEKAAANGGITEVKTVNLTQKSILNLVQIYETEVRGN